MKVNTSRRTFFGLLFGVAAAQALPQGKSRASVVWGSRASGAYYERCYMEASAKAKFLEEVRRRFKLAEEAETQIRREALADLRFYAPPGSAEWAYATALDRPLPLDVLSRTIDEAG